MKIAIIGAGNMGGAYAESLLSANHEILIIDSSENQLSKFENKCSISHEINQNISDSDFIILAVKPQSFSKIKDSLKRFIKDSIIISIMAGMSIDSISKALNSPFVVRVMPNLAVKTLKSMNAYFYDFDMSEQKLIDLKEIISSNGKLIKLDQEESMDAFTAIAGSGPGYVYFLMEALIESSVKLGFSKEESKLIVKEVFEGALSLVGSNDPKDLRMQVTSKGGTTEAGISAFEKSSLKKIFVNATKKAYLRAKELNED